MELSNTMQKFILHWGEMGTKWGVNRTVAQIHALLYISPEPLQAEEIATTLSVARSNVSTSIKELQTWGIIKVIHVMGDRRDHFESMKDVWEMFQVVINERKRREIDPTMIILRECVNEAKQSDASEIYFKDRLSELLEFFETMNTWYNDICRMPINVLTKFVKMGGKVKKFLGLSA